MYLIISYSKPVFWLSSYPKKPAVLLFHFAFLLAISRGRNPGRDCAECFSPTGSFRYEVHPMRCFHYPPPRYSHRPSRWKSTYRMPWHSYLKILNFHQNSQNYCQLTRYLKYTLHPSPRHPNTVSISSLSEIFSYPSEIFCYLSEIISYLSELSFYPSEIFSEWFHGIFCTLFPESTQIAQIA